MAGSLSLRRTGFIAAVLPTLTNTNFADTAHGLTDALRPEGYQHPDRPIDHAVGFANLEVGRAAARYLIEQGHRRIAAIGPAGDGPVADHRAMRRLDGFAAMLGEAGLAADLVTRQGATPFSFTQGAEAIGQPLEHTRAMTAACAVSDLSAIGAVTECQRRGISVPDGLSIMGFGDFEIGRVCMPSLTTIRVDARGIGVETGRLILEMLGGEWSPAQIVPPEALDDLGFEIIERQSVQRSVVSIPPLSE